MVLRIPCASICAPGFTGAVVRGAIHQFMDWCDPYSAHADTYNSDTHVDSVSNAGFADADHQPATDAEAPAASAMHAASAGGDLGLGVWAGFLFWTCKGDGDLGSLARSL
jgi:hypothetical protein